MTSATNELSNDDKMKTATSGWRQVPLKEENFKTLTKPKQLESKQRPD